MGLQNFLIEFYQVYQKVISPTCESIFYLFEKARYFCAKNLSIEEFWHEFERLLSGLPTSLDLHIPPNLELVLGNRYLASYKKMNYLESNWIWNFLLDMNFLKGLDKHSKWKLLQLHLWKWIDENYLILATWSNICLFF